MADHAISADPAVQAQLDRLATLSPGADILGLERIAKLLDRLGNPERRLPPVLHVAGTNGKGSTCAALRAAIEGAGRTTHVYTSPHLVRFNERIRIAGTLIDDALLAALLAEVLDIAGDIAPSFFEVTTAAAFLAFARTPADACIVEVGLGGRLDATNVLTDPAACGIAQLGIDHQAFLGDDLAGIAAEKAGIAKSGAPLLTMAYPPALAARIAATAEAAQASLLPEGQAWSYTIEDDQILYRDTRGTLRLDPPRSPGPHQPGNLALAVAMLRHQNRIVIPDSALIQAGSRHTLARADAVRNYRQTPPHAPPGTGLWIDGAHNPAAAEAVAPHLARLRQDGRPLWMVTGLLANKDAAGLLAPLAPVIDRLIAVPCRATPRMIPPPWLAAAAALGVPATTASDAESALTILAAEIDPKCPPHIVILGSLYLAGTVLAANGTPPD